MPPLGPVYVCLHCGTSLVSRLIRWQNRSDYSHASLVLPTGEHIESREGKGVLWHSKFTLTNPTEKVDWFAVNGLTATQLDDLWQFLQDQKAKPYDWPMVFGFVSRSRTEGHESGGKWFCSELVFAALAAAGHPPLARTDAWEVAPGLLARSPHLTLIDAHVVLP
jgi:uncharacterized protein YycO